MLMVSLILIYSVCGLLSISTIFLKKKGVLYYSISALTIMVLIVAGILSANYINNFNGFSLISIIAIVPLFLSFIDLSSKRIEETDEQIKETDKQVEEELKDNAAEVVTENATQELDVADEENGKKKKFDIVKSYSESDGKIFQSLAYLISAFLIAFAGFYLGKVSPFGMLVGLPAALIGLFIALLTKKKNLFDILSSVVCYMAVGLLIGQIVAVLIYSFAVANILFAVSSFVFAAYILTSLYTNEKRVNIILYVAMICLCLTILFF